MIHKKQSEHIGQWATPHDRRLGGIGRVGPTDTRSLRTCYINAVMVLLSFTLTT